MYRTMQTRSRSADTDAPTPPAGPDWPLPTESERPYTGHLCTTFAMVASADVSLSGGYATAVDLIPVTRPAGDAGPDHAGGASLYEAA